MDVRAENRGRPHPKVRFPAAPVVGRNFLTPGHPGVRVRNVRAKSGPKSLCLCCFFFPEFKSACNPGAPDGSASGRFLGIAKGGGCRSAKPGRFGSLAFAMKIGISGESAPGY